MFKNWLKISAVCALVATIVFCGIPKIQPFSAELLVPVFAKKSVPFHFRQMGDIAKEPLRYIGHGAEAIAFASADDQYVVKFFLKSRLFQKHRFKPRARLRQLTGLQARIERAGHVLERYETGLLLAPEETAMLAVHQYTCPELLPMCTLVDRLGNRYEVDLNSVAFVVQKKCCPLSKELLVKNPEAIDMQVRELFNKLSSKGFVNLSGTFYLPNFAVLEDKAIMIDLGKLEYKPEKAYSQEEKKLIERYTAKRRGI